ncbi:hypothetical protein HS088_TW13G00787 [Tripterygium wilfordii]|uniref:Uncharacterized protein n=1 Tax=Tripterygium wilfordii TaxID=458696 RepID=A0A7J7CVG5_TRIWF|nr:uncharacterized protein LOC120012050 [Tripterygium wilfordii]KAF5737896.1 hypothetical protein HS088_TW13G00787 [Tripterygium wilfordii]
MEEPRGTESTNGVHEKNWRRPEDYTLDGVLHRLFTMIFHPDTDSSDAAATFRQRIKNSLSENGPLLREATTNTGRTVLLWTRGGSPLRALLVISVGTIALLALTGLLVFMLFFLAVTVNAVVISLLVSLAAVGGFLAIFFTCVTAIYIGALSVAAFVISVATISAIVAFSIAAGWIGFFCMLWLATKKSVGLAKQSLNMTSSAISTSSSARNARYHPEPAKVD